jgi:hypothetical protein
MCYIKFSKIFSQSTLAATLLLAGSLVTQYAHAEQNNEDELLDLSTSVEDAEDASDTANSDPVIKRLKELVSKGKSSSQTDILEDSEMRELRILINRYGFTKLKNDGILTQKEWLNITKDRAKKQRALWQKASPNDGMNEIRLTAPQRLNKCVLRSQADYFMNLEEDAIEHRIGMSEIYTPNNKTDTERKQERKALNQKTAKNKLASKQLHQRNVKRCKQWVKEYSAWLKKYEGDIKQGKSPSEAPPIVTLETKTN